MSFWRERQYVADSEFLAQSSPYLILPHDWSVIYRDLGYESNPCAYLNNIVPNPSDKSTWRDSWLEAVIRLDNQV